jgi:stage II sporulation protein D
MGKRFPHEPTYIRVGIIRNAKSLNLTLRSPYQIKMLHTDELLAEGEGLRNTEIFPISNGIKIGESVFKIYGIKIETKRQGAIYLNNRRFRGSIDLIKNPDQKLLVINRVDIEDYLYGVLRGEVPYRWPLEALKAQAVCARTFALYQDSTSNERDYNLTSDVYSQVYGGKSIERFWTNRAVNRTLGEVLTYQNKIFPTYYHASCGGYTEDAAKIWGVNLPPLKGVKDPFCKNLPYSRWKKVIALSEIQTKLSTSYKIGRISNLITGKRDKSGRIQDIKIVSSKGKITILANEFRHLIGINLIKSTNFKVKITGKKAVFSGLGWGHGVGLCQWGAYFMARKGYTYKDILEYYYPGAEIRNIYTDETVQF